VGERLGVGTTLPPLVKVAVTVQEEERVPVRVEVQEDPEQSLL
jgi:hypothetical protein